MLCWSTLSYSTVVSGKVFGDGWKQRTPSVLLLTLSNELNWLSKVCMYVCVSKSVGFGFTTNTEPTEERKPIKISVVDFPWLYSQQNLYTGD